MKKSMISLLCFALLFIACKEQKDRALIPDGKKHIKPYKDNPRYWQYDGLPVMLIGGSPDDNLFQVNDLSEVLKRLKSCGGNYVRNTMSSRNEQGYEIKAYAQNEAGKYDLDKWNAEYWKRFEDFLKQTHDSGIVVQIELFDPHDLNNEAWLDHPYFPGNNINYDEESTKLPDSAINVANTKHAFFLTVPDLNNDTTLLAYQQKYVDKVLEYTLNYDHVLYCITNEIFKIYQPEWGWYWADYLKDKASDADHPIFVTEMFQSVNLYDQQHMAVLNHADKYDYLEASQNSANTGQQNWDQLQFFYNFIADKPRPLNNVKIYGGVFEQWTKSKEEGAQRFWRAIIGGSAAVRFHRPPYGLGLSEWACTNIRSASMLMERYDYYQSKPGILSKYMKERDENEAFFSYVEGSQYAIYFPMQGEVQLNLSEEKGKFRINWLNINKNKWQQGEKLKAGAWITLKTPSDEAWVALIEK